MCWRRFATFKFKHPPVHANFSFQILLNPKTFSSIPVQYCEIEEEEPARVNEIHGKFISLSNHWNPEISCFYHKGFSQITKEVTGKALHTLCIKDLTNLNVFLCNTLITMYYRFGQVRLARNVFDKMGDRNEASWNNMMSGFVRAGYYYEACSFLNEMRGFGVRPSGLAIVSLIAACERSGCLFWEGIQVHDFVVKLGLLCDVFVGTSLLQFYGAYGLVLDARKLFVEMPKKNLVSWTVLMVAYQDLGDARQVMSLYQSMRCEGVACNDNILTTVISSCGSLANELLGHQVVGHIIKFGFENNTSVANSLISMFGGFGFVEKACFVFGGMDNRDTISWNSIISAHVHNGLNEESLRCFHLMRHVPLEINSTTLSTLLSGLAGNLKWGRGIHCIGVKVGMDSNIFVRNTLICMYSQAGEFADSELIFLEMVDRDLFSWNSMVACYVQEGNCVGALKTFATMLRIKMATNYVTFTSVLAACSNNILVDEGRSLHALSILSGLHENLIVGNALITLYAKSGMIVEAKKAFISMPKRDIVTWNTLIGGLAENDKLDEAMKAFNLMREEGIPPDHITHSNILGACSAPIALLEHGMPIHAYIVQAGFESDEHVQTSLITMYAKCGDLNASNYIFDGVTTKNNILWNAIIAANAYHGFVSMSLAILVKMRCAGVRLDQFSFSECLTSTAKLGKLEEGRQLHSLAVKLGFDVDPFVVNAIMDMYGKCGQIDDVLRVTPLPTNRSKLSWNILISAFSRNGFFEKAMETFNEMIQLGVIPDQVTLGSLSLTQMSSRRGDCVL